MTTRPTGPSPMTPKGTTDTGGWVTDLDWGAEVRKNFSHLFDFNEEIKRDLARRGQQRVSSGEIWYALPDDAYVTLSDEDDVRTCPGIMHKRCWFPQDPPPPGSVATKMVWLDHDPPSIDLWHFRPGIVLGERLTAVTDATDANLREILRYGRMILVPGGTKPAHCPGELRLLYPQKQGKRSGGNFQFWMSWGISSAPGIELLSRMRAASHVRECTPEHPQATRHEEDAYTASRRVVAEVLGLRPPHSSWRARNERKPRNGPARGEIVEVAFGKDRVRTPCVVISTQEFNDQPLDIGVVLQCLPYKFGDEESPVLVPLGTEGRMNPLAGQWSVSVTHVRGISHASTTLQRGRPALRFDLLEAERFADLHRRLEYFYA